MTYNQRNFRHGEARNTGKTKEYRAWCSMIYRCYYPSGLRWHRYGERGIKVCSRWLNSFPTFLRDMGRAPSKEHSLDRIDNDGDYKPSNCRWATRHEQMINTWRARKNRK